jgi:hypothetical protein
MPPEEIIAALPDQTFAARNPFTLKVKVSHKGALHEMGLVPDLVFGLMFADGSRPCFMVEIDRGTMPVRRSDIRQTSFERKMRAYLTAHAARQYERQFGRKTFRTLVVTTDQNRIASMTEALQEIHVPNSLGAGLFLFATRDQINSNDPIPFHWHDGMDCGTNRGSCTKDRASEKDLRHYQTTA